MSDIDNDDFFSPELETTSSNDTVKQIEKNFKALMEMEEREAQLKAELEGETAGIRKIKSETLPELLKELGTEIWRDPESGIAIELETAVNSSLPKNQERRNEILDALRPIGIEQIMAEEFSLIFTPNDKRVHAIRAILGLEPQALMEDDEEDHRLTNAQMDMVANLREALGLGQLPADEKLGVHPSRLKAWLKEQIDGGQGEVIREAGIWFGKHAKVVRPKTKKGGK